MSTEQLPTEAILEMQPVSALAHDWLNNPEAPSGQPESSNYGLWRYFRRESRNKQAANEMKLANDEVFDQMLGSISMHDVAVIPEGRKRPRSLDQFEFVPIRHTDGISPPSLGTACESVHIPQDIRTTYYGREGHKPYLDTQIAIGLTRDKWLVALAAAGVSAKGSLRIVQIQDVSGSTELQYDDPKIKFKTGLRDGFLWRDTLVTTWGAMAIGLGIGSYLEIQSSENNMWSSRKRDLSHYDEVATRMGFKQANSGNWRKPLPRKP